MFLATLLVVAQLTLPSLGGISLNANLSEPNDIQPALGVNVYQPTVSPQLFVEPMGFYQPTLRSGAVQPTSNPQYLEVNGD